MPTQCIKHLLALILLGVPGMIISDANLSDDKNITDIKENQQNLCYIYRHIRLDKNEVFYIGKGTNTNGYYERAYSDNRTNPHWHNVVKKHGYKVEIIIENLTEQEANEKEIQLILDYGRIDLGTGTLVNMTEGGEGCLGRVVSEETLEKIKQTNLERYGVENCFQNEIIKEKIKQTNLERYGVENPTQSSEIRDRTKQTNLERYGVEHISQSSEIKEKIKQTNLERYGYEYVLQSDMVQEKIKKTNLERYGVECTLQAKEFREKSKQTSLDRYGVTHPNKREYFKEKMRNRIVSEETLEKMRNTSCCKKVGQYKDGNLIKEYRSVSSTKLDGYSFQAISKCCRGEKTDYKGYQWKFL